MNVLGIIPARGGSKGVPNKNIKLLGGKPLFQHSFECARDSKALDRIIISTDDIEIADVARSIGLEVPFLRPDEFAQDDTAMIDVVIHALQALKETGYVPDAVLLLQPTSPVRQKKHILKALELLDDNDSVCSVIAIEQDLCPHYLMKITDTGYLDYFLPDGAKYTRRQDVPLAYKREGTVFLTKVRTLVEERSFYGKRCIPMIISPEESLNIDTLEDWIEAEHRFNGKSD